MVDVNVLEFSCICLKKGGVVCDVTVYDWTLDTDSVPMIVGVFSLMVRVAIYVSPTITCSAASELAQGPGSASFSNASPPKWWWQFDRTLRKQRWERVARRSSNGGECNYRGQWDKGKDGKGKGGDGNDPKSGVKDSASNNM